MEFKTINKYLENLVNALREENEANTEMLDNFYTYLETDDKKYLKLANNQLREILKGAGFGILLVLPFSPITIPYLLKRAQKLGIDINFLPIESRMSHLPRKDLLHYNWQLDEDKTPHFIKYGKVWFFSGFDKATRNNLMEQTWEAVKDNYK